MMLMAKFAAGVLLSAFVVALGAHSNAHASLVPSYAFDGNNKIVMSGGFLTSEEDGNFPIFFNGSIGEAGIPSKYYNESAGEVYFINDGTTGTGVYKSEVNILSNNTIARDGVDPCWNAIRATAGSSSGSLIGINARTGSVTDGCTTAVRELSRIGTSSVLFENIEDEFDSGAGGITVPTCSSTDRSCQAERDKAIAALDAAACSGGTSSLQAIANCERNKAIVECLRSSPGKTYKRCADIQAARAILDGDFSAISAESTDKEIEQLCNLLSKDSNKAKCIEAATAERDRLAGEAPDDTTSCAVQGIGWIICPMITFVGNLNDAAFGILSTYFLEIDTSLVQDKATRDAWTTFRDIANVLFVIAFVVIVYTQMIGGRP